MGEDEVYLVTVYTGHELGSGTTANVCIELNGTIRNSRVSTKTKILIISNYYIIYILFNDIKTNLYIYIYIMYIKLDNTQCYIKLIILM